MFMEKNSALTPFIAHEIRKLTELGVSNILYHRFKSIDPTCKPTLSKGKSLSLEKVASVFVFFFAFIFVSFLILLLEKLISHYLPQKLVSMPRKADHNKAIETGIISLIMDIKKTIFMYFFKDV